MNVLHKKHNIYGIVSMLEALGARAGSGRVEIRDGGR